MDKCDSRTRTLQMDPRIISTPKIGTITRVTVNPVYYHYCF